MSRRGGAGVVVLLIVIAVGLGVGVVTWSNLDTTLTAMKPGMSATANTTIDSVIANTWSGFNLNTILPIIAAASVVLAAIYWLS